MHRPGSDALNMEPTDFLCDFCHKPWSEDRPMVEGHQGSLICAPCICTAYTHLVLAGAGIDSAFADIKCTMCIELRGGTDAYWQSPIYESACICRRCLDQGIETLEADTDTPTPFLRPAGNPA